MRQRQINILCSELTNIFCPQWWSKEFQHLLPRMEFVVGDMFVASSLPKPEPGRRTLYVLKQILHDWSDADSLAILRALRSVMGDEVCAELCAELCAGDVCWSCVLHNTACLRGG